MATIFVSIKHLRMGKLADKRTTKAKPVRKSSPAKRPRKLMNARKHAGTVPGLAARALDEVRKMRDEW